LNVWSVGGLLLYHSLKLGFDWVLIIFRFVVILSQIMYINMKILIIDIIDPIDEIIFQVLKALGKSEYRRGIPFNPKKCWGKNVIFTPMNMVENWILVCFGFMVMLKINGAQWVKPAIMANTAPIDKT